MPGFRRAPERRDLRDQDRFSRLTSLHLALVSGDVCNRGEDCATGALDG
jgi:hypothetical protein